MSAFVPARAFSGPRPGWFFGTGAAGTGYYRDDHPGRATATTRDADGFAIPAARPPAAAAVDGAALLAAAEAEAGWTGDGPLDGRAARRLAAALDKAAAANAAARARHPDSPDKFMASELGLDAAVRACGPLAAFAGAWADFVDAGGPPTLATLIASHENADIAAGALDVLSALTDEDAGGADDEDDEAAAAAVGAARAALIAGLRSGAVPAAIAARLPSLDEGVPEEAAAVADGLAVLQALVEVGGGACATDVSAHPAFLAWLLGRCVLGTPGKPGARAYDAVTGAASELVAVLAQAPAAAAVEGGQAATSPPPAQAPLLAAGAVDALLRGLASYRSRDPADAEEGEHLENLGDALCALLVGGGGGGGGGGGSKDPARGSPAQAAFLDAEGVELAVLLLRKKGAAAGVALRALDFALPGCPAAAVRTVEAGGLGPAFAAFMGTAKSALGVRPGAGLTKKEAAAAEARAVGVVCHLLQGVGPGHPARGRLAAKLAEADGEKCERAVDLFARWEARVGARADAVAARTADPAAVARARLDAGLFTLHQLALILGHAWGEDDGGGEVAATTRRAVVAALHSRGGTLARVRAALREYKGELGDGDGDAVAAAAADAERARVAGMLSAMGEGGGGGGGRAAQAAPPPPPPPAREDGGDDDRRRSRHRSRSPGDGGRRDSHRRRSRSRSRSPRRRRS